MTPNKLPIQNQVIPPSMRPSSAPVPTLKKYTIPLLPSGRNNFESFFIYDRNRNVII